MSGHYRWIGVAVLAGAMASPVGVSVQSGGNGSAPATKDWATVGGDWGNARYS